jgi:pSer/pThr/pTyr-binding forkhead associated (FHA) protein
MTSGADAWLVDERWFKAYPLVEDTTIGRGAQCVIILRDPAVSRVHAEVKREHNEYVLYAQGSSGTKVNGARVTSATLLQEGDVVEIAFTTLRFTRHAPTGEMFVVPRDAATTSDRNEIPTRATLHALHPITIVSRWPRYWRIIVMASLILLVFAICAGLA